MFATCRGFQEDRPAGRPHDVRRCVSRGSSAVQRRAPGQSGGFRRLRTGTLLLEQAGAGDLQHAVEEFRRAIDADPTYAAAYAGWRMRTLRLGSPTSRRSAMRSRSQGGGELGHHACTRSRRAARLARVRAHVLRLRFRCLGTGVSTCDPAGRELGDGAPLLQHPAHGAAASRRSPPADRTRARARSVSPLVATDAGFVTFYDRRYDDARVALEEAIKVNPKAPSAHFWLARTFQAQGHRRRLSLSSSCATQAIGNFAPACWRGEPLRPHGSPQRGAEHARKARGTCSCPKTRPRTKCARIRRARGPEQALAWPAGVR